MNRIQAKELLPVITAFANGEDVQYQGHDGGAWYTEPTPSFSACAKWRIAPKPKTCERWCFAVFYPDGEQAVYQYRERETAEKALIRFKDSYPSYTFSPIVRVEFVEEQRA